MTSTVKRFTFIDSTITNGAFWYLFLWCVFLLNDVLYPSQSIVYSLSQAAIYLWSIYCALQVFMDKNVRGMSFFVLFLSFYGLLLLVSEPMLKHQNGGVVSNIFYLKELFTSFLPVYVLYYYWEKGVMNMSVCRIYSIVLIAVCIVSYFSIDAMNMANLAGIEGESTNNVGYRFLKLFPLAFLWRNNEIVKNIYILVILIFIISSFKRGAIFIAAAALLYYAYTQTKNTSIRRRILSLVIISIAGMITYNYTMELYENSAFMQYRVASTLEGSSSQRDSIYSFFWNYFWHQDSFLNMLVGNGAFSTVAIYGQFAHDDWLELLINQGIIGIIIYFFLYCEFYKKWKLIKRIDIVTYEMIAMFLIIFLLKSIFSMSYSDIGIWSAIPLSYCYYVNKKNIIHKL